ncbi:porin [Rivihabitans pingtungensis]|uniref:porin n=2 Tax=Rivihabitans pingtungensis TaxID=1054498 RepID=UPI0023F132A1|nr:porin [Rivihabitans pingtungensis]
MKKLIALAVAALPMAAMADVTLYGTIEASIENGKSLAYSGGAKKSTTRIDDTGSLIGFKGSENLGNGLKAIWQVEQGLNIDGTTGAGSGNGYNNTWATRDSFVGLTGNFGTVRLGKLSTYLNSDMEKFDAWIYGAGVNGATVTTANTLDGRLNNAIRYDSPNLNGFKFTAAYGFDEARTTINGNRSNKAVWNLGAGYENAGYFVDAGYVAFQDTDASGSKDGNYWRLEGGYNANNLLVALAYGQSKLYAGAADATKAKEAALTVGYTMGALTPKFTYAHVWDTKTNGVKADDGINQYVIGVDYALSKRTTAYTSFGYVKHDNIIVADTDERKERTLAVGVQHKF